MRIGLLAAVRLGIQTRNCPGEGRQHCWTDCNKLSQMEGWQRTSSWHLEKHFPTDCFFPSENTWPKLKVSLVRKGSLGSWCLSCSNLVAPCRRSYAAAPILMKETLCLVHRKRRAILPSRIPLYICSLFLPGLAVISQHTHILWLKWCWLTCVRGIVCTPLNQLETKPRQLQPQMASMTMQVPWHLCRLNETQSRTKRWTVPFNQNFNPACHLG